MGELGDSTITHSTLKKIKEVMILLILQVKRLVIEYWRKNIQLISSKFDALLSEKFINEKNKV